jgi:hypothetical protein
MKRIKGYLSRVVALGSMVEDVFLKFPRNRATRRVLCPQAGIEIY